MDLNFVTNVKNCYVDIPSLLYYSHIPTATVALLVGFFVLIKDKKSFVSKLLFVLSLFFLLWSFMDIILWITYDSRVSMFFWSIINLTEVLVSATTLYFAYVFIEKKDVELKFKIFVGILLSIFIIFIPTKLNLLNFNGDVCEGTQGPLIYYFYFLEILFSIWLFIFLLNKIKKYWKTQEKRKVVYFSVGLLAFLFSFSGANIIGSALTTFNINILGDSDNNWKILQYGLFGMPIFIAFLAYLIVKFEAFNIKMIGAQALVLGLVILIGSQFFFIQSRTNMILNGITFFLVFVFGWMLIRSIKIEIERKDELQSMSNSLAIANDKLRKLDNAKSEFISIASHQLRTPLTAIKGFVSLLLEGSYGKISGEVKETLNKVYFSNERLIDLVESLLDLSRIESGRMEYKFEKVKLDEICKEVYDTFAIRAREKGLYLEVKTSESLSSEVTTDKSKVREVISNLVDNALKYSEKGGVKIKLSDVGEKIRLAVVDTGIGVPPEEVPYLFSKFSRGKDINRLNAGGTGLGLHVGKRMVEALGGEIGVESKGAGYGSTFFIEVPKEHVEEE